MIVKIAWALIGLLHLVPGFVFLRPEMLSSLYGVETTGNAGMIAVHRAAWFLSISAGCLWAILDPSVRRVISVFVGVSIVSFLIAYARAGLPAGEMRGVAIADTVALLPLGVILWSAWR
ncbi:MAG: hypothetical protein AAGA69_05510 [Pseudomonadota bacterium]